MSVVSIELKKDGRQIKQSFTGSWRTTITTVGSTTIRRTTPVVKTSGQVVYVVRADKPDELPITLLADPRLPQLGATYVENGVVFYGVYYSDATPRFIGPRGRHFEWEITYSIGGDFSKSDETQEETTLLSFSTSTELEDYASASDLDGLWNCNSLGEFFADPLIFKTRILTMQYQRREYSNPLWKVRDYNQRVNSAALWGFDAGTLKVADLSFSATATTAETTYDVSYKIQYRPRGWSVEKANAGFYYLSGSSVYRALNEDGSPTESPVLLAANGTRLPSGATPPMRSFRVYQLADLAELDLPDPFSI